MVKKTQYMSVQIRLVLKTNTNIHKVATMQMRNKADRQMAHSSKWTQVYTGR